jgi:hypothetical protein
MVSKPEPIPEGRYPIGVRGFTMRREYLADSFAVPVLLVASDRERRHNLWISVRSGDEQVA